MRTGIDPKVDYAFKRVFGSDESRAILIDLLNAVLAGSGVRPVRDVEILNPFSRQDALDDRLAILDVRARDDRGRECLVEMQMLAHRAFRERLLYYLAKDYSQMLGEADEYTKLRPVIVVCFINDVLCPETPRYHSRYELLDPDSGLRFSDHWAIHVVELPKFTAEPTTLANDLDRWAYFLQHGEDLDPNHLPPPLETTSIRLAKGLLQIMSHNTLERDHYEARLKFQRDQSASIATAREEGWEQGLERVLEQGLEQGRAEQTRALILRIGTKRLGAPSADVIAALDAIADLDRLNALADRILDCATWDDLLPRDSTTPTV